MRRIGILAWAVGGVLALFAQAVWKLAPRAWEAWTGPLRPGEVVFGIAWILFMAFAEGYRGFQKAFSPRLVARARHLADHPSGLLVLIAPLYAMALARASPRRLAVSWGLLVLIVAIVVFVQRLPQPWRGLIDAGVVVGLAWGMASILAFLARDVSAVPLD